MEPDVISGIYAKCSGFPILVSANVTERQLGDQSFSTVTAEWSQTDLVRGSRLRYSQQWTLTGDANNYKTTTAALLPPGPCIPVHGELLSQYSPSGDLRAVVRETGGHQLLEIWGSQGLSKCLDLTALNKHGGVYEDAQFGCLSWSDCQSRLLYVAERSRSASEPQDKSVYCEDWGEGLTSKSAPALCVLDVERGTLSVLQGTPSHVSPGQALWAPDGQSVVFVGWWHEPFRLGLRFCSNRRSAVFKLGLDGHCECLSVDNMSVSCPRLSPDKASLVFLQGGVFGPHSQCLSLQLYSLESRKTTTLLDVVNRPPQTGEFAGIYEALPSHCWSADSQRVVFSSAHRNWKDLFVVGVTTRMLTCLSNNEEWGSWKLLTIEKDLMVVSCSSPRSPPCLRVGFLPSPGETVTWRTLYQNTASFDFQWKVLDVTPSPDENNTLYSGLHFGAVLVKPHPLPGAKSPLVVFIHGGPHSQFPAEWNVTTAGLAKLGYAVLMVNYRGSTGFGQDGILSLIGQIGNQDVKDVQRAVLTALQSDVTLDPKRLAVIGGSHGGFLSCHLIGQYPDFYRACAARNPVINAATLLGTSDIVDWRYSSVGLQYSYDQLPTAEALASMLEKSPITHAAQIKAPVLLMLGGKDRRVSPHQGLELYRALKSRGTPVRAYTHLEKPHTSVRIMFFDFSSAFNIIQPSLLAEKLSDVYSDAGRSTSDYRAASLMRWLLWYPEDGHSLVRVNTQADCFLNTVLWLQQHL